MPLGKMDKFLKNRLFLNLFQILDGLTPTHQFDVVLLAQIPHDNL